MRHTHSGGVPPLARSDRQRGGFTVIELFTLLAILSGLASILGGIVVGRETERRELALAETDNLAAAESSYLSSHGEYGTIAQLISEGLAPEDLADEKKHGYLFSIVIDPPPLPAYRLTADPCVPPLSVGFFVDETGVVRYALDGSADASSAVVALLGSIPTSQAETALEQTLEDDAVTFVLALDALPGVGSPIESSIDLLASPGGAAAIQAGLDGDGDNSISLQVFLADDTLALARSINTGLGLPDTGGPIGDDAALQAMIADYKAQLEATLEPDEELAAPEVPTGPGFQADATAFLLSVLGLPVPAVGLVGMVLLAVGLIGAALSRTLAGQPG
jgi:Tfp pilus assembly protein PilE